MQLKNNLAVFVCLVFISLFSSCKDSVHISCFSALQGLAKKEKHCVEKQKTKKTWPKEFVEKKFTTLIITGPANLQNITVSEKAVITGPATIKNSTVNKLVLTGPLNATDANFSSATVTGPVSLVNCTCKEDFFVTGAFKAFKSNFNAVDVTGAASLNESIGNARLKVTGALDVTNSTLHDIDITTNSKITVENSSVNSLIVHRNHSDWWLFGFLIYSDKSKPQIVETYLKGDSAIKTIEFEPGVTGIVILEDKSASVGTVKNGIIKKQFEIKVH